MEEVLIDPNTCIYEWEKLFIIRKINGELETIRVGFGGRVSSLEVEAGDQVIKGMVLALIKEEVLASCSD